MPSSFQPIFRNGAGPQGQGLGGAYRRRHRKLQRDNILGITKSSIRKLARRGGVRRIKSEIYDEIRATIKARLEVILQRVVHILEASGPAFEVEWFSRQQPARMRKTVTTRDVVFALNGLGMTLYGFDWYELGAEKKKKHNRRRDIEQDDFMQYTSEWECGRGGVQVCSL